MPKATIEVTEEEFKEIERLVKMRAVLCLAGEAIPDPVIRLAFKFCKAVRIQRGEWEKDKC